MLPVLLAVIAYFAFRDQKAPGGEKHGTGLVIEPPALPPAPAPVEQWHACELAEDEAGTMTPEMQGVVSSLVAGTNADLMRATAKAIEYQYPLVAACLRARAIEVQRAANTGRAPRKPSAPPFIPEGVFTVAASPRGY